MERYVGYQYYASEYGGTIVPEAAFSAVALKASAFLDRITFGRITEPYPDEVRMAACQLVEMQYQFDKRAGEKEIKSDSNDGYSVSYVTEGQDGEPAEVTLQRKMYAAARVWLGNTELLYLGVSG